LHFRPPQIYCSEGRPPQRGGRIAAICPGGGTGAWSGMRKSGYRFFAMIPL
jgi:hypothetical protein